MFAAIADTHAVIWYVFKDSRLSKQAKNFIDGAAQQGNPIGVSSISLVEIIYLVEKGRVHKDALVRVIAALEQSNNVLTEVPLDRHVAQAVPEVPRSIVSDPSDRIIAATALHLGVPLISRDRKIQLSDIETIW
jgi:PIN domain nuclease of toxin-antitoxin system